ncbi:MAG: GNAT family N-acetyltransferase [Planctomycetes bacterium]|nr:GNAT family N-acetyltransferase [Planctomycetota bacterium]
MDIGKTTRFWERKYVSRVMRPEEAVRAIQPGQRVFIGSGAGVPLSLVQALTSIADEIHDAELLHILTLGMAPTAQKEMAGRFRHSTFFVGSNIREAVQTGHADYTPIFLSEIPDLFKSGAVPIDVALIKISPPDRHGFASYGVAVDIVKTATEAARHVIAEVNPNMPRTLGDSFIHLDEIDTIVFAEDAIPELPPPDQDEVSGRIGQYVASLVEDGATIQMGIGAIPDAALANLFGKKDLGIHTEMFSDGVIPLVKQGVITNAKKTLHRKKIVTSFVMGTRALYDFVDNNPMIEFRPSQYTNDPFLIAKNDKMTAINSALEVDLTGQVCADSIGHRFYSGIGGQVDFIRGAAKAPGGKPIIALPSTAKKDSISRVVVQLSDGAGVVTTRGDVHYVVTEYGIAYLHGKSIRNRALSLINIAHPKFRKELLEGAKSRGFLEAEELVITDTDAIYPLAWEKRVTIADGSELLLRPIKRSDEDLVKDLFYSQSDETRYYRFFTTRKFLPKTTLQYLVNIDYNDMMALCAVEARGALERIVGVARYYLNPHNRMAELGIAIHDDWQRKGLGKALLSHLIDAAKEKGVKGFTADVLADNVGMFKLLAALKIPVKTKIDAGVGHVEFSFEP